MRHRVLMGWLAIGLTCAIAAQEDLPPDATLASIAHSNGIRGGDLAVELGLPRETNKQQPLAEMGVTREQLEQALEALGSSLPATAVGEVGISLAMTLPEAAEALGITGQELAHDLGVPIDAVQPHVPMAQLGVGRARLRQAVRHNLAGHHSALPSDWKYPLFALIVLFALLYLLRLGIPKGADPRKRWAYYPNWPYVAVLLASVVLLGFTTGKSPNPMEGVVKVFKATVGMYDSVWPYVAALAFFLALAIVANKAVCGWACPFGALEELLYMLPLFRRAKRLQLPSWVSNTIRALLFVAFVLVLYGLVGGHKGFVLYHYANPFNLFNQDFSTRSVLYLTGAYLVVSLFFYRPFCRFICPFGFLSWIVERISLTRIRIDRERCIDCQACAKACPLPAAGDRLSGKALPADCFSCMRCLRVCPADAIHYGPAWGPASPPTRDEEETETA